MPADGHLRPKNFGVALFKLVEKQQSYGQITEYPIPAYEVSILVKSAMI